MDIHTYFSLTYSNYLVVRTERIWSQSDRDELAAMAQQLWLAYPQFPEVRRVAQLAREWDDPSDLSDNDLRIWDIKTNAVAVHENCSCGPEPVREAAESAAAFDLRWAAWDDARWQHERDAQRWYYQGEEYERGDRILLPAEPLIQARQSDRMVLPRTLLQSMPKDWQERLVALLQRTVSSRDHRTFVVRCFGDQGEPVTDPVPDYNRGRTYIEPAGPDFAANPPSRS